MQTCFNDTPKVRRLLLVEDDPLVSETIAAMLEEHYDIVFASTVALATASLSAAPPPTIILLDCLLPDGSIAALLNEADRRGISVVLTSGDPRQSGRLSPDRPFLPKPFHQDTLLKILDGIA